MLCILIPLIPCPIFLVFGRNQAVYRAVSVRRDYCRVLIAIEVIQRVWR